MQRLLLVLFFVLMGSVKMTVAQDVPTPVLTGVEDVEFVEWVTGPDSPSQTDVNYGVLGTDLGSMFDLNGTLYVAFGDTFGCCRPAAGGGGGGQWRYNVLAYTTDHDLEDGITLDGFIVNEDGRARAVLRKQFADFTIIPTAGIAVGDRMYLHYMAVRSWDEPGHWTLNRSGWGYSDDGGQTWTQPLESVWQGDTNFGMAALLENEGFVYVFGTHGGRYSGIQLARVPSDQVLDMSAYTYWDGSDWGSDIDAAVEIVPAPVGELSVAWNDFLGRWIMTYLDEPRHGIVIREAPELTGPWSEPMMVVSSNQFPSLYGSYLHPWASDGEVIYFNMSQWGPYNVMLMRARLVRDD
ncbi:MAG: hypothetical protein UZ15_CFX003003131 [Chloroflexi bacterium OLB15]|nr:MAG: hypothetical protein UZ15_CFX003003131 [Chloroflexi bacterium OLB15]